MNNSQGIAMAASQHFAISTYLRVEQHRFQKEPLFERAAFFVEILVATFYKVVARKRQISLLLYQSYFK